MKKLHALPAISSIMSLFLSAKAFAGEAIPAAIETAKIDTGDSTFILISAALVMLMTPGLALFYGGMVRTKNVLNTIMQSFACLGIVSIQWVLIGYSLAFGPDINHLLGSLDWLGLANVGQEPNADYAATLPHLIFMIFQGMFAIITAAIMTGAFAERMKFSAFIIFTILWTTLVYDPVAHWVWGVGGWMRELGILDFAGGTVVHILSGVSGLVVALVIGRRKGYGTEVIRPHHLPMTVLGASLLWFGWFGFNAGSALGINGIAANAFVTTNTAAAAGILGWVLAEWLYHGKPTILGAVSGAISGLVGITPAAGFVSTLSSLPIGCISGIICFAAVSIIKTRLGYDDTLDAFGIHGIGGIWGAIATGIFTSKAVNPAGADGLLYGNAAQVTTQLIGVVVSCLFAIVMTLLILKVMSLFVSLRTNESDEYDGLDIAIHGERGYAYQDLIAGSPINSSTALTHPSPVLKPTPNL